MREIRLTVRGDTVHASRHRAGIQGECNATALVVSFDDSWDAYTAKKITFWDALGQEPVVQWLNGLQVGDDTRTYQTTIPGEPLKEAGECTLVIDGLRGEDARARSIAVRLTVEAAPKNDKADDPAAPSLDQYEQVVGLITENAERAEKGAGRAEQAAALAEGYTSNPPKIGENGNWWTWDGDVEDYVDTCTSSQGEQGPMGVQGERGLSGVYVGSGDMPEDCTVQIDPDGEIITMENLVNSVLEALPAAEEVSF